MFEKNSAIPHASPQMSPAGCSSVAHSAIGGDLDQVLLVTDDFVGEIFSWVQYWMEFGHLGLVLKLNFVYCNGSDEPVEKHRQWVQNNGDGRLRLGPDPLQSHCGRLMNILQGWAIKWSPGCENFQAR